MELETSLVRYSSFKLETRSWILSGLNDVLNSVICCLNDTVGDVDECDMTNKTQIHFLFLTSAMFVLFKIQRLFFF